MVFTPFVNNSHGFLYLSSQTCSSNTSLPACSFYYCLTLKKNTTEYEAGGSTALMIMPKCLLTCGFILFLFTCYFCTTFNTERIFFCSLPASPSIWNTNVHDVWVTWPAEKSASLRLCVLKLLVWTWASQVLTRGRESRLPLCLFLRSSLTLRCWSQLPFVNCLIFFIIIIIIVIIILLFWFSPHECQAWHEGWTF